MKKAGSRFVVTVPMHKTDVPRGTLRGILEDAGISDDEFATLLGGKRS
jgi:predicted RNA binding protein YcfA (HicA-like mRNA interferase family)